MAKKSEILNEIHNRINESITGGSAVSKDFGLKKVINECLSVGAPEVIHILQQADSALSEGVEEKLLIRPLLEGLSRYESLFDVLKKNCDSMRLTINENLDDINLAELYESIENDSIKNFIGSIYKDYCNNKNLDNRAKLVSVLESVSAYDKNAGKLMAYVKDGVIKNDNVTYLNPFVNESVNESKVIDYNGQKFVQDEDGRLHAVNATDIKKIYENVDEYINQRIEESKAEKELQESKTYRTVDNGIHLYEHVRKLQQKYPENVRLQETLSEYASALQAGCREEMLYETFCARMKGGFDFLDAVDDLRGAVVQIVDDDDILPRVQQGNGGMAADKTGAAGQKNGHEKPSCIQDFSGSIARREKKRKAKAQIPAGNRQYDKIYAECDKSGQQKQAVTSAGVWRS